LDYGNYEVILLPDEVVNLELLNKYGKNWKIKVIPTGPVKPSAKRNLGIRNTDAEVLALIDSDAYPTKNWLKNAIRYFQDDNVGAVGGPNLTPSNNTIGQKVSGLIFSSSVGAGKTALRYKVRQKFREGLPVKEMPSCNLLVRREHIVATGGFDERLLTGEDAKLCFQIRKYGKRVIYAPDVVVYHHRRHMWRSHLQQVWNYGRDKAWVIKEDFSIDKLYYSIPFCFVLFLTFGTVLSIFLPPIKVIFLFLFGLYLLIVLIASMIARFRFFPFLFLGIILTHIFYGVGFFLRTYS
jgi:GT2 family glycosyltransferase